MAALRIGISYTPTVGSGGPYNFLISEFNDRAMPRRYVGSFSFSKSTSGASILGGTAYGQKYTWTISTKMNPTQAQEFDEMFRAWDEDRAAGHAAAVGIIDETWGADVDTSAVFLTAPVFTRLSPLTIDVSFGLEEV